eukprot:12890572-Prorocentrum_lima.AAC.1
MKMTCHSLTDIAPKRASTGVVGAPPGKKTAVPIGAAGSNPAPITGQKRRPDTQGGPVPAGKGRFVSPKPPPGSTMQTTGTTLPKSPPDTAVPAM